MSWLGDGIRALANAVDATTTEASRLLLGPAWGSVTTPTQVRLTDDANGPRVISYEEIYRTQPAVAAVVNKIARQIVRLPLRAYQGDPDGEFEPLPASHELVRLLRRPAPRRGPAYLKQALILPVLVHGNSVIGKYHGDGDGRPPTELLKFDWPHLHAYARRGGPVALWTSTQMDGLEHPIDPQAVVHIAWDSPSGNLGISPLEQLGTTVSLEDAARRYQAASFANGVRPSGALTLPKEVRTTETERREMREDIERMHAGVDNAFRMALLTGGAEFQPMSFNAQEAALIEARVVNREESCIVYDMPPPLIGDFTRATYSNVEETNRALYKIHIPPWLVLAEDALQAQLIDPQPTWADEECFARFDLSEVLKGDPVAEATAQGGLVTNGIIARDEARQRLGLKRRGGAAGELTHPANNERLVAQLPAPTPPGPPAPENAG